MPVLLATSNPGKLRELRSLLAPVALKTPPELDLVLEVNESGQTFAENAEIKARAFARAASMVALADDSGLEVDALGGEPGVHSARYGGADLDDVGRLELLLHNLREVTEFSQRSARFKCCMVVTFPDGTCLDTTGVCEGFIAQAPSGASGFGYDPIFYLPDHQKTMAEIPTAEKNRISHRAKAAREMASLLRQRSPELF